MSLESTLKTYGQIGVKLLQQAVAPHDATGKTRASIRFESTKLSLKFFARNFFELLEKGIRPSTKKPSKPSTDMIKAMTEYATARGFKNPEKAAWAISIKQLKEGDTTHKRGGRIVYSDDIETFKTELREELTKEFKAELKQEMKKEFKNGTIGS